MQNSIHWKQALASLKKAVEPKSQYSSLRHCTVLPVDEPSMLKTYHDVLLFICVNPFQEKAYQLAMSELVRLVKILEDHRLNRRWQYALSGTGLPFSEIHCQYSATLVDWLLVKFPQQVLPVESGTDSVLISKFTQFALPGVEFHLSTQGNYNIWSRIKLLSGHYRNADALRWLLELLKQQNMHPLLKDQLYDELKIFVSFKPESADVSRTYLRWPVTSINYRLPPIRKLNNIRIIKQPVEKQMIMSLAEKEKLISLLRTSLALYARETDPVTFADMSETSLYDLGEGLKIALTGMIKTRRLSLESYIGYMAFKNGFPVSYGGGWIWGHRCKIGINIYPPYRGGESDRLFCQIMRLYYQVFAIRRFVVKPYQFGKGNPEGLKSGAFWFYYKLGFRPVNKAIREIAAEEWKQIINDKKYRTPTRILKSFTACNKEWDPEKTNFTFFDADKVSITITNMIGKKFDGNRVKAAVFCLDHLNTFLGLKKTRRMQPLERNVWENWSLLFSCLPDTGKWTKSDREKFVSILDCKALGPEIEFILSIQRHRKFWSSLQNMLENKFS